MLPGNAGIEKITARITRLTVKPIAPRISNGRLPTFSMISMPTIVNRTFVIPSPKVPIHDAEEVNPLDWRI